MKPVDCANSNRQQVIGEAACEVGKQAVNISDGDYVSLPVIKITEDDFNLVISLDDGGNVHPNRACHLLIGRRSTVADLPGDTAIKK